MMNVRQILKEIQDNIKAVIEQDSDWGVHLWQELLKIHPADIADFFADISHDDFQALFLALPKDLKLEVFENFSDGFQAESLSFLSEQDKIDLLNDMPVDRVTDLLELLSDQDFRHYHKLLHKKAREKVLSLLKFHPETAGGIMDIEVITLVKDFTVEKSIKILQRLSPSRDIHQQIYVTDTGHRLVGHIKLEDLVLHQSQSLISSFMQENEYVAQAEEDRETVAKYMVHYSLMTIPVVGKGNHFLGVISSETLVDVLVEEASEDVQKMAALTPLKYPYFETSFFKMLFQRSYILIPLLLFESLSGTIIRSYEDILGCFLISFIPMLTSAGGYTSSQTSAMAIQGMASGDIRGSNMYKFLRREFLMACMLALVLSIVAFIRIYYSSHNVLQSLAVGLSLGVIVVMSVTLGSCIPFALRRFHVDPVFFAGPFLATIMDIVGVMIYCYITTLILKAF
ncbi:MAG: magnesium transporter [Candidatus Dependentiae bacterium]|nr:magnesium transporter [Candidatus Dependentiae bacterium]